jgi:hypothetical protein
MREEIESLEFSIPNEQNDNYEITDCAAILRYLESVEKNAVKVQDHKRYLDRVESRINYIMFE